MTRKEYAKKLCHIREYLVLKASPMKKKIRTYFRLKVKIKTIYNATCVYLHSITFTASEYEGFCLDCLNEIKQNLIATISETRKINKII